MGFLILGHSVNLYAFDPMRIQIRTILPKEITTVGAASQYYAQVIGYRLVTSDPAPKESAGIAAEPISPLFFTNRIMAVEDAILAILRAPNLLVIDHEHRVFSFEKGRGGGR
jgi:hypothetical protein